MKFKSDKLQAKQKTKQIKSHNNGSQKSKHQFVDSSSKHVTEKQYQQRPQEQEQQQQQITWKHRQKQNQNQQEQQSQRNDQQIQQESIHENSDVEEPQQQNNIEGNPLAENQRNLEQYQNQIGNRGVIYMSRIPPYMTPNFIRKLLQSYSIERIYFLPQSQWVRNNRIKKGGSKRICFRQGWIEFSDKKQAKMVALSFNGHKMVHKKGSFYSEDVWNLKYLPKFKWHHLTERLAHQQRLKKQKLRLQMDQQRKVHEYYTTQVNKSRVISGMIKNKIEKGKQLKSGNMRLYGQKTALQENQD